MTKVARAKLIEMLNETFANKKVKIENAIWAEFGPTNPHAFTQSLVERAPIDSYEYFLAKLEGGEESSFDDCKTNDDVFYRLKQKAKNLAMDYARRKSASSIVHGILDAPRSEDEPVTNLEYFEAMSITHDADPLLDELTVQAIAEKLSELSDEDRQFMDKLVGAQLDGGYVRPPLKAVAEELGTTTHKVQYRWKQLQKKILELTQEDRD
jgi:DNA-directed RNA polymerase specialized sigma54-like protein